MLRTEQITIGSFTYHVTQWDGRLSGEMMFRLGSKLIGVIARVKDQDLDKLAMTVQQISLEDFAVLRDAVFAHTKRSQAIDAAGGSQVLVPLASGWVKHFEGDEAVNQFAVIAFGLKVNYGPSFLGVWEKYGAMLLAAAKAFEPESPTESIGSSGDSSPRAA